jgi:hypothetical protein
MSGGWRPVGGEMAACIGGSEAQWYQRGNAWRLMAARILARNVGSSVAENGYRRQCWQSSAQWHRLA